MKRGRPRHDDILTPRQWQVLDLLQDGLTNEQIGERLGMTADGAKYHVAEIISKLGVRTRVEAVEWYLAGAEKPWWYSIRALLPLGAAGRWVAAVVVLAVLVLIGVFAVAVLTTRSGTAERSALVNTLGTPGESGPPAAGYQDGPIGQALFSSPHGLAIDGDGNVYVADQGNNKLRKIAPDGNVSTIDGPGQVQAIASPAPGIPTPAPEEVNDLFFSPLALATDDAGNVYLSGDNESVIYRVTPDGQSTPIAGDPHPDVPDLSPLEGPFAPYRNLPLLGAAGDVFVRGTTGIAVDSEGNVYLVGDSSDILAGRNQMVRKITPDGQVVLVAGSEQAGYQDGPGDAARFDKPYGIAIDQHDNLYVTDVNNHRIRKIAPDGTVSTFAGSGENGFQDGPALQARFSSPQAIAVADDGTIYVSDAGAIRMITTGGIVETLAGAGTGVSPIPPGFRDGPGNLARFTNPAGLAAAPDGDLYIADVDNNAIRKLSFRTTEPPASTTPQPAYQAVLVSSNEIVPVMVYDDFDTPVTPPLCYDVIDSMVPYWAAATTPGKVASCTMGDIGTNAFYALASRFVFVQGQEGIYLQGVQELLYASRPVNQQETPICSDIKDELAPGDQPLSDPLPTVSCIAEPPLRGQGANGLHVWAFVPNPQPQGTPSQAPPPNGAPATTPTPALPPLPELSSLPAETSCFDLHAYYERAPWEGSTVVAQPCVLP